MSHLRPGDGDLHYSDNSHRWIAPKNVDQERWDEIMRAHLAQHRAGTDEQPTRRVARRRD